MKYLSPLRLSGLNGVVILNGVAGGTRSAVFFSVLLLNETLTPARWLDAAMMLSSAMRVRTSAKVTETISPPPPRKVQNLRLSRRFCFIWRISR